MVFHIIIQIVVDMFHVQVVTILVQIRASAAYLVIMYRTHAIVLCHIVVEVVEVELVVQVLLGHKVLLEV
jgi:hypothetical protein